MNNKVFLYGLRCCLFRHGTLKRNHFLGIALFRWLTQWGHGKHSWSRLSQFYSIHGLF